MFHTGVSADEMRVICPELRKNAILISQSYASILPSILLRFQIYKEGQKILMRACAKNPTNSITATEFDFMKVWNYFIII